MGAVLKYRHLLWSLVVRDLKGRYVGSTMGMFWNIINPLITIAVYTFVFSYVMKAKVPAGTGTSSFVIFFFCGLLPWMFVSETIQKSSTCIIDNANLVKKINFPNEILVLYIAVSGLVHQFLAMAVFWALFLVMGLPLRATALLLPAVVLVQVCFTLGISFFVASLNLYFRDVSHVLGAFMSVWFFGTPIVYPIDAVPPRAVSLIGLNPMTQLVETYRSILLRGDVHTMKGLAYLVFVSLACLLLGYYYFKNNKKEFPDLV